MDMKQLKDIYDAYERELMEVLQNAKPLAGWFGISNDDPRNAPCHQKFYDAVGDWVQAFTKENPSADQAEASIMWILGAAAGNRKKPSYWYYLATQGYVNQLLPFLGRERCAELVKWYDKTYPRRERLPVNDELYGLMKKAAK